MRLLHLTLPLALMACSMPVAEETVARPQGWQPPELLCTVQDTRINESSGVACSTLFDDTLYTHNDSGDSARFFRFTSTGRVTGVFTLQGAGAVDWEAMASVRIGAKSYLYLGDIGDNLKIRQNIKIYRVEEPTGPSGQITSVETYTLTYPGGANNAEALLVKPGTGDIYIVTKTSGEDSKVFRLGAPLAPGSYAMQQVGTLRLGGADPSSQFVTAGDFSPDGSKVVLRTYQTAYEYVAPKDAGHWPLVKPKPIVIALEGQGEAICFTRDGRALITTSEGSPMPVSIVRKSL